MESTGYGTFPKMFTGSLIFLDDLNADVLIFNTHNILNNIL